MDSSEATRQLGQFGFTVYAIVFAIVLFLSVWPMWRIAKQAGYSGPLSLLMLIPIVNWVLLYVFAFSTWPVIARQARFMPDRRD